VAILKSKNILVSMTENGYPYENALAERITGILKGEYLEKNITTARQQKRCSKIGLVIQQPKTSPEPSNDDA
jgi:hypothetical protein